MNGTPHAGATPTARLRRRGLLAAVPGTAMAVRARTVGALPRKARAGVLMPTLPVQQARARRLVDALGVAVPRALMLRAGEVIE